MAEIVVGVIAEGILNKALSFASDEISLLWGFKQETQKLANKMQMMQALLTDAENKQLIKSAAVQLWLKRLENVALDADNVLDELAYEGVRQKIEVKNSKRSKVRNFFSSSNPLAFRHKMGADMKNINFSLDELYREANGIGLMAGALVNSSLELNEIMQTGPFVDDSEIVGRNDDISSIVAWLVNSDNGERLPVISIVGMPGQGKTTVAQLVYKNDTIVRHFDYRLWVCVSDNFKVDMILNEMVESVTQTHSDMTNREAIVKKLQGILNNKRFFLVLDDVWNENRVKWDSLKKTLLEIGGSSGSNIMVTTRSENVCSTMEACMTHRLGTLSSEECCNLFKQVAFANGGARETPELMSIGKRMLKRCGGVPLAVKALGGLLYARKYEREWLIIERSELWGFSEDPVLPSLRLSYNHLPSSSLKQCFGFCSIYPKDSIMEKDKLVQLWMAQGYLNCFKEFHLEMEDIGSNYFNILLRNSLLLVDKKDDYGDASTCKMHDLVHDLGLDVSKNYCLMKDAEEVNEEIKVVNLSLVSGEKVLLEFPREHSQRLRTLFFGGVLLGDTLIKFKNLHILILSCKDVMEFPSSVRKLRHLRYLDVSGTKIFKLPDSISKLYSLQTLRLYSLEDLPKEFGTLTNLRHFYIEKVEVSDNQVKCLLPGIGQLTFLQTLPYFVVSQDEGCQIYELQGLSKLRGTLKIYGLETIENGEDAKKAQLEDKSNIHTLEYHWSIGREEVYHDEVNDEDILEGLKPKSNIRGIKIAGFHGLRLPPWIMDSSCCYFLGNLVKFELRSCIMCEQIPPLGCLPCLKIVEIYGMDSVLSIGNEFYGLSYLASARTTDDVITVFPALKHLSLRSLCNLVEWFGIQETRWSVSPVNVFPLLEELTVSFCEMLECLPDLRSLRSLRKLSISFCRSLIFLPNELGVLKSLEEIRIIWCNSLIEFPDIHDLQALRLLFIQECPELTDLPKGLQSLKLLRDLNIGGLPALVQIPDLRNLQSLRWLGIDNCQNLRSLPSGLEYCTSLDYVEICNCPSFLLEGLHLLRNLRKLTIGRFSDDLDYFPWMACKTPEGVTVSEGNVDAKLLSASLKSVWLRGWPKVTSLPDQLQYYPLTDLVISDFEGLVALPDWLGNIKSLQELSIWHCKNLMYFPSADKTRSLNNLKQIDIKDCPLLEERCTPGTGSEWHKISHIPIFLIHTILKS